MHKFSIPDIQPDGRALINGKRVAAASGATFASISPINGQHLADIARCDAEDINRAVTVASASYAAQSWSGRSPKERKLVLLKFAQSIRNQAEELALLETLDMGKPIGYAKSSDVAATANCIAWYGEAIDKLYDEIAPTAKSALALIRREPLGVVGAIVPWNYPMIMAAWKIAPALALGNSVVLKPSEKSPLTAMRLGELALEAGLPPGVLNVVPGYGPEAGEPLARHMEVDCIAFTGSTAVGKRIHVMAGESNLKRAWTELGGKSPNIIFADCPDTEAAAKAAIGRLMFNQGESCNAPSRLLVERTIADALKQRLVEFCAEYQPANPLLPETTMGALVDSSQLQRVMGYIHSGSEQGARLLTGGQQALASSGGFYVVPTIFDQVQTQHKIAREEIFGPVLTIMEFATESEAVELANDTIYGLQAGVWTSDINRAIRVSRALRAGTVHVNQYDEDDLTAPFGGFKQSGIGRDKSLHALDKYAELKTTWIGVALEPSSG